MAVDIKVTEGPTQEQIDRLSDYLHSQPDDQWRSYYRDSFDNGCPATCQMIHVMRKTFFQTGHSICDWSEVGLTDEQASHCFLLNDTSRSRPEATARIMDYLYSIKVDEVAELEI